MTHEALEAITEASSCFVDMEELVEKSGKYLAKMVRSPDAYITNGAAAGIVLSVGAVITMGNMEQILKLPDTTGMKNQILVQASHFKNNPYISLLRIAGGKIKVVGNSERTTAQDLVDGITKETAAVFYVVFDPDSSSLPLRNVLEISHSLGVPVIVDAAAELPPASNLMKFVELGSDLVVFSGGKDIGSLSNTGVIFGRLDLIDYCKKLGPLSYSEFGDHKYTTLGRPMKTSKEGILALVAAIEKYLSTDQEERIENWKRICNRIEEGILAKTEKVKVQIITPGEGERIRPTIVPRIEIRVDGLDPEVFAGRLKENKPPIFVNKTRDGIALNPQCLESDEIDPLIEGMVKVIEDFRHQ